MDLTRAQIVGLFGVATDLPVDTTFVLEPPDHYNNIIVSARSEHTDLEVRYKLFVKGGREQLPVPAPKPAESDAPAPA